jgi:hypothetical protein
MVDLGLCLARLKGDDFVPQCVALTFKFGPLKDAEARHLGAQLLILGLEAMRVGAELIHIGRERASLRPSTEDAYPIGPVLCGRQDVAGAHVGGGPAESGR